MATGNHLKSNKNHIKSGKNHIKSYKNNAYPQAPLVGTTGCERWGADNWILDSSSTFQGTDNRLPSPLWAPPKQINHITEPHSKSLSPQPGTKLGPRTPNWELEPLNLQPKELCWSPNGHNICRCTELLAAEHENPKTRARCRRRSR